MTRKSFQCTPYWCLFVCMQKTNLGIFFVKSAKGCVQFFLLIWWGQVWAKYLKIWGWGGGDGGVRHQLLFKIQLLSLIRLQTKKAILFLCQNAPCVFCTGWKSLTHFGSTWLLVVRLLGSSWARSAWLSCAVRPPRDPCVRTKLELCCVLSKCVHLHWTVHYISDLVVS